jgi:hypothetical protein
MNRNYVAQTLCLCPKWNLKDAGTDTGPIRAPLLRVNGQRSACAT